MSFETWLAFTAASAVLILIPGPTVLLVVSYALGQGWRAALPMAIGVALGDFAALTLSLLGLGALMQVSSTAFMILKWAGAVYLIWLGLKLWRAGGRLQAEPREGRSSTLAMMSHAFMVTMLNPKSLAFFAAFLPQFMDPSRDWLMQAVVMEATFLTLAFANVLSYAFFASKARHMMRSERPIRILNRAGGTLLIGAGVATAAMRQV